MLRYLLSWKTYRTLKSGLLLDFLFKRLVYKFSNYFFYTFTIFFGDKYILEYFFSNLFNSLQLISTKLKQLSKNSFINFFKATIYISIYFLLILAMLYII